MDPKKLYKITVKGRVQGVGFRQACLREARYRGLSGFVKNNSDGSVSIEAVGNSEHLNELVAWCQKGPGYGSVEEVTVEHHPPVNYNSFIVRY